MKTSADRMKDIGRLFQPTSFVNAAKLTELPGQYELVEPEQACSIHQDSKAARDKALAIGILAINAAMLYFPPDCPVDDRWCLLAEDGTCWIVTGSPARRTHFPATAHITAFALQTLQPPDGVE